MDLAVKMAILINLCELELEVKSSALINLELVVTAPVQVDYLYKC